jgi:phosphohistidine swiveling domain-containing protein
VTAEAGTERVVPGIAGAAGEATGPAHVVHGVLDVASVPVGSVLVTPVLNPYASPVLFRVAALVVEEGGVLQHATRLAREFGIPAVLGVTGATELFEDGELLAVRGDRGEVVRLRPDSDSAVAPSS